MTKHDAAQYDADWVRAEEAKRKWMAEHGLYAEEEEHSSCGVGLVVSIDGKKSRKVVEAGIDALKAICIVGRWMRMEKPVTGPVSMCRSLLPSFMTRSAAPGMSRAKIS